MRSLFIAMSVGLTFGTLALGVPDAGAHRGSVTNLIPDFAHFQIILDRQPFGQPPPAAATVKPDEAKQAQAEQALAKQIRLCAVTRTDQGVAAGLIDSSAKPPKNYYLYVGEVVDGLTLVAADLDEETAEIEKDGARLTFTLTGVKTGPSSPIPALASRTPTATVPATSATVQAQATTVAPETANVRPALVLRSSQDGMPARPYIPKQGLLEALRKRDELLKLREEGGDIKSYMERLRDRKQQESTEKATAEQAARDRLQELARKITENELAKKEREINLSLIEQGARPISDITLTPEEEKALVEKGVLP